MLSALVGCEFSGVVRRALRARGIAAWSCDLLPADDDSPFHIQGDVLDVLDHGWDLLIAHPPCTYLCNSGVRWLHSDPERWAKMRGGAEFFRRLLDAPIPHVAVENPIMHKYAAEIIGRRQDQVLQPYMFGHPERKATCLWLKNLPSLVPTNDVYAEMMALPKRERERLHYLPPSPDRWKLRSTTYEGIAVAMAEQYGDYIRAKSRRAA